MMRWMMFRRTAGIEAQQCGACGLRDTDRNGEQEIIGSSFCLQLIAIPFFWL